MSKEQEDRRLRELDEFLSAAPVVEPPPELAERILTSVQLTAQGRPSPPSRWWHALTSPALLRYGFAAAAGALVVAMVYETNSPLLDIPDLSQVMGTLSPDASTDSDAILDAIVLDTGNVHSIARLRYRGGELVLDIHIDSDQIIRVDVDLGVQELAFEALVHAPGSRPSTRMSDKRLRIEGEGRQAVAALLRGETPAVRTAEIRILFTSEGYTLKEGVLRTDSQ